MSHPPTPAQRYSPTQAYRPLPRAADRRGQDACALYASVEQGRAADPRGRSQTALVALEKMLHRAGNVDGEGDGCGVLIDIPRKIWAEEIRTGGHASQAGARRALRGRARLHPAQRAT